MRKRRIMSSSLRNPLVRPPTLLATLGLAFGTGLFAATLHFRQSGAHASAPRVVLVLVAYFLACAAVVIAARLATTRPDAALGAHVRTGVAAALVLGFTLLDLLHFQLFKRHIDAAALHLGWQAVRSKSIAVGLPDLLAALLALIVLGLLAALAHAALSRFGADSRSEQLARAISGFTLVLGLLGGLLRERLWDEDHVEAARLARALPFASNADVRGAELSERGFGGELDAAVFAELGRARAALGTASLSARTRPDLLIVHVESLRGDMVVPELMPGLVALGKECHTPQRHYATGNNTGSAVFGLVSGLNGFQYPAARKQRATALPLVVLKRLGYRVFTHFANNLRTYDDVFEVVFAGGVDQSFVPADGPSEQMDRAVVQHYLGSLGEGTGPRFDYLVLDSTHYDYAYPPEYEKHVPSGTLALGLRDGFIEDAEVAARAKERAQLVKNRYLNAVGWVDAQLSELVAELKAKNRWASTLVVIVGDHGEAFWEHGSFGHGMGLEEEQIRVASMFCGVGPLAAEVSSHADVFPTWFAHMGLSGVPGPFMNGRSLLDRRPEAEVAVSAMGITGAFSSRRFVAVGSGLKLHFDNSPRLPIVSATDLDDRALGQVPDDAERVLGQALATKLLRSPAP